MPTSKDISTYPALFWQLTQHAHNAGTYTIRLPHGAAIQLRLRYYAWRRLLEEPTMRQLANTTTISLLRIDSTTSQLTFQNIDTLFAAIAEQLPPPAPPAPPPPPAKTVQWPQTPPQSEEDLLRKLGFGSNSEQHTPEQPQSITEPPQ